MFVSKISKNRVACILLLLFMVIKGSQSDLKNASPKNFLNTEKQNSHDQLAMDTLKRFKPLRKHPVNQKTSKSMRLISRNELNQLIMMQRIILAIGR